MADAGNEYLREVLEFEAVLRAYIFRITRNMADVDELLQETYARLLASPSSERHAVRSLRAYALTVARNVALDWLRHRDVVPVSLMSDLAALDVLDENARVEEVVNAHQELALLAECVADLPERGRQAFTLRRIYGLSQAEVAERLGISEGTVEQLIARAVRRCAEYLFAHERAADSPDSLSRRFSRRLRRHE